MEKDIIWLPFATECIDRICAFLAEKSHAAADRLDDAFVDVVNVLSVFPEVGSLEPCLNRESENYRYLVVAHHYKLIYCVKEDCVEIAAAWDCRREPGALTYIFQ